MGLGLVIVQRLPSCELQPAEIAVESFSSGSALPDENADSVKVDFQYCRSVEVSIPWVLHGNMLVQPIDKGELERTVPTGKRVQFLERHKLTAELQVTSFEKGGGGGRETV